MDESTQPAGQQAPANVTPVDQDEKFFAALGYFGPLFVLPLIAKPQSVFCKFHAKQSMVLLLITVIVLVFLAAIPTIGSLFTLALFAVYVLAIYRAYIGQLWNIPLVSNFAGKMDLESLYSKAGLAVGGISQLKEKAGDLAQQAGKAVTDTMGKQEGESTPPPSHTENAPKK